MKYALIGDLHGTELSDLEKALKRNDPDVLVCTCDFDRVKTIHQFRDLEKRYRKAGKTVITVPGNHDHSFLYGQIITSARIPTIKKFYDIYTELKKDSVARQYMKDLVGTANPEKNNRVNILLDENKFGSRYNTLIIHGALDGDAASYDGKCPIPLRDLWLRLLKKKDHKKNFAAMDKKGYDVMIRGHNHEQSYTYCNRINNSNQIKRIHTQYHKGKDAAYELKKNRMHTINPGALIEGHFATIDTRKPGTKVPVLMFHRL